MYQDKPALLFIMTALVTGLCGAFFYPLSSLFIVEALGASP
ncbi:MFS transporter, partial [Vibrio vulnificus]|nr:MFS transporter [Vibrio vulnificus]